MRAARRLPALLGLLALAACQPGGPNRPAPSPGPRVTATLKLGRSPGLPVLGGGFVWVPNTADGSISKVEPRSARVVDTIAIGGTAGLLARGCGTTSVHASPVGSFDVRRCDQPSALAFGFGSLWATRNDGAAVLRIDPRSDRVSAVVPVTGESFGLATGPSGVWVTDYQHDLVTRIDPAAERVVAVLPGLGRGPAGVLVAPGAVWVSASRESTVLRIDPRTDSVVARVPTGKTPLALALRREGLWVRNEKGSSLSRIDPARNQVAATLPVDYFLGRDGLDGLGLSAGGLWVSGVRMDYVDAARGRVTRNLTHSAVALTGDGAHTLWSSDLVGTVSRIEV